MNRRRFFQGVVTLIAATTGFVQVKTRATFKSRVIRGKAGDVLCLDSAGHFRWVGRDSVMYGETCLGEHGQHVVAKFDMQSGNLLSVEAVQVDARRSGSQVARDLTDTRGR